MSCPQRETVERALQARLSCLQVPGWPADASNLVRSWGVKTAEVQSTLRLCVGESYSLLMGGYAGMLTWGNVSLDCFSRGHNALWIVCKLYFVGVRVLKNKEGEGIKSSR